MLLWIEDSTWKQDWADLGADFDPPYTLGEGSQRTDVDGKVWRVFSGDLTVEHAKVIGADVGEDRTEPTWPEVEIASQEIDLTDIERLAGAIIARGVLTVDDADIAISSTTKERILKATKEQLDDQKKRPEDKPSENNPTLVGINTGADVTINTGVTRGAK